MRKRESGENPGQSRCCESPCDGAGTNVTEVQSPWEDVCFAAMSQKTCRHCRPRTEPRGYGFVENNLLFN